MVISHTHRYVLSLSLSLSLSHTHTHRKTELAQDIEPIIIFKIYLKKGRLHFITIDTAHFHIMQTKACLNLSRCLYSVFTSIVVW